MGKILRGEAMTQRDMILDHLLRHGPIDPMTAKDSYGVMRLAARINELREVLEIKTVMIAGENRFGQPVRYARYSIDRPALRL